ncbi:hypothetical protein Q5741_19315 [Paenibacillus sp. JX-17]|uniref:Lipoprotein n=1 Tax=Paenibacillus lacisoli TaxID=3064525 RepID=A0ABT9CJ31_9BACL|nr:hypothetical protein [Paenibacillus sp. JX-17]MDO7908543.1 hypothetical protein [Paenibacillus sp. JX-17]
MIHLWQRMLAVGWIMMFLSACGNPGISYTASGSAELSPARIQDLRTVYPLAQGIPELIEMRELTFQEVVELSDSVIIAEVIQRLPDYRINLTSNPGTPEGALTGKPRQSGNQDTSAGQASFADYQVKVNTIITGKSIPTTIHLITNTQLTGVEPDLMPGMKLLVAVQQAKGNHPEDRYSFTRYAAYYIVDERFVLEVYEGQSEQRQQFSALTNGKTLENLMDHIRNMNP